MNQANRRQFLMAASALLAAPMAHAQQKNRVYRIGLPSIASYRGLETLIAALGQGLRELGYLPGKDIVMEFHSAEGKRERLPEVLKEVVRSKPDVIITGPNTVTTAAQAATQSIPIVMTGGTEVIDAGYARSFATPGGNITGITDQLVAEGLVERMDVEGDRRAYLVRLTPQGREQFNTMARQHEQCGCPTEQVGHVRLEVPATPQHPHVYVNSERPQPKGITQP